MTFLLVHPILSVSKVDFFFPFDITMTFSTLSDSLWTVTDAVGLQEVESEVIKCI